MPGKIEETISINSGLETMNVRLHNTTKGFCDLVSRRHRSNEKGGEAQPMRLKPLEKTGSTLYIMKPITQGFVPRHSPMDQNTSAATQAFFNESIAAGEMLKDVLIIDIIYLNDMMFVWCKQAFIKGKSDR